MRETGLPVEFDDFSRGWRNSSVRAKIAVRALTALPEDLGAILSSHISSQPSITPAPGDPTPSPGLPEHLHTCSIHT